VVRALEVYTATGKPISELQQTWDGEAFQNAAATSISIPAVMLEWPREALNERIDERITQMIAVGWLDECRRLRDVPMSKEARQAVGYAELFAHLDGTTPNLEEVVERIRIRTRQFAKRQMTWFRKLPVAAIAGNEPDLAERAIAALRSQRNVDAPPRT